MSSAYNAQTKPINKRLHFSYHVLRLQRTDTTNQQTTSLLLSCPPPTTHRQNQSTNDFTSLIMSSAYNAQTQPINKRLHFSYHVLRLQRTDKTNQQTTSLLLSCPPPTTHRQNQSTNAIKREERSYLTMLSYMFI